IREPWRMTFAWLAEAFGAPQPLPPALTGSVEQRHWEAMAGVAADDQLSPVTTSAGRLFDAVGALCGIGVRASYEGQAAVELEWAAARAGAVQPGYEFEVGRGLAMLDPRAAVRAAATDLRAGV